MAQYTAKVSGTRGEITPLAQARRDIDLYKAAFKTLYNWYVLKEGGTRRRSGTRYRGTVKYANKDTRLVNFRFSSTQTYAVEMGDLYTRFWTNGGQVLSGMSPYEIVSPFAEADLRSIQWVQSFDTMYFAHASKTIKPKKLLRTGNASWSWADIDFVDGPYLPINDQDNSLAFSALPYPNTTIQVAHANLLNVNGGTGFVSSDIGRHYRFELSGAWAWGKIASIVADNQITVDIKDSNFSSNDGTSGWARASGFTSTPVTHGATIQLTKTAGAHTLTNLDVGKILKITVIDGSYSGDYFCVLNSLDGDASAPKINVTFQSIVNLGSSASKSWQLGAFSDTTGYPGSVCWYQGRLCWGRTDDKPFAAFYGRSGLPENYAPSDFDGTVTDSHGGIIQLLSADEILWMHEAPRLQVGTSGAIRSLGASDTQQAFSPRNVSQRIEVDGGVSGVVPIGVGPSTVHVGRYGIKVNDLYFDYQTNGLVAPDLSIVSEHMFDSGVKELWFQQYPNNMFWTVLNNGTMTATTIERYEKVIGFSRHELAGAQVISGCVVQGSTQDDFYMVTRRTINGVQVQYMETLEPRFLRNAKANAWFVDCGGQYSGAPTNTVSGITWLEGETVEILADGARMPDAVVTGGIIHLPTGRTASKITFGKAMPNTGGVLPAPIDTPEGSTLGRKMRVVNCIANVYETLGLKFTSDMGQDDLCCYRVPSDPMGQSPALVSGKRKLAIDGSWGSEGTFTWSIDGPFPGTILAFNIGLDFEP